MSEELKKDFGCPPLSSKYKENEIKSDSSSNKNSSWFTDNENNCDMSCSSQKTREQILYERKIRKQEQKMQNKLQKREEKRLQSIESSRSKKVSIIDQKTMDRLKNGSNDNESKSFLNIHTIESENKNSNQTKCPKRNDLVEFSFNIINKVENQKSKPIVKVIESSKISSGNILDANKPIMLKGKKYENKKKTITKLKKTILQCRNEKILKKDDCCQANEDNTNQIIKPLQEMYINNQQDDVKCINDSKLILNDSESAMLNVELKSILKNLIGTLFNYQNRAYKTNPVRANMRRRYVIGFHEVLKSIKLKNVFLVVVATDIEKKGCEEVVNEIKSITSESEIPLIFALKRREIGYLTFKKVGVSCLAILSKDGVEELFNNCLSYHKKILECNSKILEN